MTVETWAKSNPWKWALVVMLLTFFFLTTPLAILVAKVVSFWKEKRGITTGATKTGTDANAIAQQVKN